MNGKVESSSRRQIAFFCDKDMLVILDQLAKKKGTTRSELVRAAVNEKYSHIDADIPIEHTVKALEEKIQQLQRVVAALVKDVRELREK